MKKNFLIIALFTSLFTLFHSQDLIGQSKEYKVVFDLTSPDTVDHQSVIRWLNGIVSSNPNAQLEVVFYGQSLPMVTVGNSTVAEEVQALAKNKNVSFRVCAIALKHQKLTESDLIPGVETVPDGIAEIVLKQSQGWGYIKATR